MLIIYVFFSSTSTSIIVFLCYVTWSCFCVLSKLGYMPCIEMSWENGFEEL